jgi:hypothetical protein
MQFEHATEATPIERLCKSQEGNGSGCRYVAVDGTDYCPRHGANKQLANQNVERTRNYNLTKFRARVNQFADNPEIKSLREEIGIVRLMLESVIERCEDATDLLIQSDRISTLVTQIEKLVVSCHKLEEKTGAMIDKSTVVILCDSIVKIIGEKIKDSDELDEISTSILNVVAQVGSLHERTAIHDVP